MAAKTPDSVSQENLGSVRLVLGTFSTTNLDNADTYTTNLTGLIKAWFEPSTTTGVVGCNISSGVITFACSADNQVGTLYMLCRS